MSRTLVKILCLTIILIVNAPVAFSQSENGQISGQVTDPQGLNVPKAAVNRQSGYLRKARDEDRRSRALFCCQPSSGTIPGGGAGGGIRALLKRRHYAGDRPVVQFNVKLSVFQQVESITVQGGGAAQIETTNAEVDGDYQANRGRELRTQWTCCVPTHCARSGSQQPDRTR